MKGAPELAGSLHDIELAEPVSMMPQTVGWWVVLGMLVVIGAWLTARAVRRHKANRYRRQALERLTEIEGALAEPSARGAALAELPVLVKRTALEFRPRSEVASLTGDAWLRFLDASYGGKGFSEGPGRVLLDLAYRAPAPARDASPLAHGHHGGAGATSGDEELIGLVRRWIRLHDSSTPAERAHVRV